MVVGKDGWGDGESEAAGQVELWLTQVYLKFIKYAITDRSVLFYFFNYR